MLVLTITYVTPHYASLVSTLAKKSDINIPLVATGRRARRRVVSDITYGGIVSVLRRRKGDKHTALSVRIIWLKNLIICELPSFIPLNKLIINS